MKCRFCGRETDLRGSIGIRTASNKSEWITWLNIGNICYHCRIAFYEELKTKYGFGANKREKEDIEEASYW